MDPLYLIALTRLYPTGIRHIRELLTAFPEPEQAFAHVPSGDKSKALEEAKRELEFIHKHQIQLFYYRDAAYPYRLAQNPDAPIVLYGKGNLHPNQGKMVSVVGTRMPTERGKELCRRLVLDLAKQVPDVTIVSGLAYGIDITAHRAAMEAGLPTIIIPGHGLDRIYPSVHRPEAVRALQNGGILTEYPSGTEPYGGNFVARNRIIAGMADAVVVVESKDKGGSLITANMANDYSREVFTFPGRVDDSRSIGCNRLIKSNKAHLIESAEDLIVAMQWQPVTPKPLQTELVELSNDLTDSQQQILQLLRQSEEGIHINLLTMELNLPYASVCSDLTLMELDDLVRSLPGGIWMARK